MLEFLKPGLNPSNNQPNVFKNQAGPWSDEKDLELMEELEIAGIESRMFSYRKDHGEVHTTITGSIEYWGFERAWYYWIAKGPGIPPDIAEELHKEYGKVVRVNGDCGCPSPKDRFNGFAVGHYHVDTQTGLNALAKVIRDILKG